MHVLLSSSMEGTTSDMPLAVDMDGTLILSDMSKISITKVLVRKAVVNSEGIDQ